MESLLHQAQEHALLLAVLLPVAFRIVGHWVPEEPLMVVLGVLAARSAAPQAALILGLLWLGHLATDQAVFSLGRTVAPRLTRWPRVERRVAAVAGRVGESPWALAAFVPARVLPLGRGIWLLALGVAAVPRVRFLVVDAMTLVLHVGLWCGLGWWLGPHLAQVPTMARTAALWLVVAVAAATVAIFVRRRVASALRAVAGR